MGARSTGSHPTTTKADGHLIEYFRQTFVEGGGGTNIAPPSGLTATGGIISDYTESGTVYRAHVFTSSGTFDVTALANGGLPNAVEYLVVAGGGGGGGSQSGGGGAGGLRTNLSGHPLATNNPSWTAAVESYSVTVGAGGFGPLGGGYEGSGRDGGNSVLAHPSTPITALGGGGGGTWNPSAAADPGRAGGSGGGGGRVSGSYTQGTGGSGSYSGSPQNPQPYRQGYDGGGTGTPYDAPYSGGGGGGAGGAGSDATGSGVGTGGAGVQVIIAGPPTTTGVGATGPSSPYGQWFAGGGGGGSNVPQTDVPAGGGGAPPGNSLAGGGIGGGGTTPNGDGGDGMSGTGAGGGGGSHPRVIHPGGNGGSGIVIVRYKIAEVETAKATGGAISFYNNKTIHTFTTSGTFATTSDWTSADVEYLVVGGGGAGGEHEFRGGGGGAGAYKTGTTPIGSHPVATTIQIGAGGAPIGRIVPSSVGNGTPSFFGTPITSPGGGMGGTYESSSVGPDGIEGGSGGGGGGLAVSNAGNGTGDPFPGTIGATPPNGWGHPGGAGSDNPIGAGGGGAGEPGNDSGPTSEPLRGLGGSGVQVPTTFRNPESSPPGASGGGIGTPGPNGGFYLAGGGNAGGYSTAANPLVASTRPAGGGGFGGNAASPYAGGEAAIANTGGGGGGASGDYNGATSGQGGSGIVLIAYPT